MNRREFLKFIEFVIVTGGAVFSSCGFKRRLVAGTYEFWMHDGLHRLFEWVDHRVDDDLYLTDLWWERRSSAAGYVDYNCSIVLRCLPNRWREVYGTMSANDRQELAKLITSGRRIA